VPVDRPRQLDESRSKILVSLAPAQLVFRGPEGFVDAPQLVAEGRLLRRRRQAAVVHLHESLQLSADIGGFGGIADTLTFDLRRVLFHTKEGIAGILMALAWENLPATPQRLSKKLLESLDAMRIVCALAGENSGDADKRLKILLELLVILHSAQLLMELPAMMVMIG
jgi:hypothetical protein